MDETLVAPGAWDPMLAADWNNIHNNNNNNAAAIHNNNNNPPLRGTHRNRGETNNNNNNNHHSYNDPVSGRVSRLYGWLSFTAALLAICTTAQTAEVATPPRPHSVLSRGWTTTTSSSIRGTSEITDKLVASEKTPPITVVKNTPNYNKNDNHDHDDKKEVEQDAPLPAWLRWILPLKDFEKLSNTDETAACMAPDESTQKHAAAWTKNDSFFSSLSFVWNWSFSLDALWTWTKSLIDPTLLQPSGHTLPDLIDKVLTSTPRLLAMANFLLSLTYLLHTAVADWFLGRPWASRPEWQHREKLGGFLVFKLLLISAVVAPDTLDLLILLSWYTLLSFLRSLAHLCAAAIQHCTAAGQAPPRGVLRLLTLVWLCNILAAAVCVALFHAAGAGMVWLLTCDCALLAVDVFGHLLQYLAAHWEVAQATQLSTLEEQEDARLRRLASVTSWAIRPEDSATVPNEQERNENNHGDIRDDTTANQRRIQRLEEQHSRRMQFLDATIFGAQLLSHFLTVTHFVHIWYLHGLQLTLIDGVLALHLHSAVSSASRQIAQRRNLHRIARDLDDVFADATELELRKHTTDVCCVCLCGLSSHVKKVACGHLYHSHCLREVVERARSMETAKCPLCRASVLDGSRAGGFPSNPPTTRAPGAEDLPRVEVAGDAQAAQPQLQAPQQQQEQQQQQALFRFSTDAILPAWVPIPNFSFEIVRRPALPQPDADPAGNPDTSWVRRLLLLTGAVPMTPAEEAVAIEQLVDMFPQYDRSDLLRELRQRGSLEGVAEAILTGVFTGIPR